MLNNFKLKISKLQFSIILLCSILYTLCSAFIITETAKAQDVEVITDSAGDTAISSPADTTSPDLTTPTDNIKTNVPADTKDKTVEGDKTNDKTTDTKDKNKDKNGTTEDTADPGASTLSALSGGASEDEGPAVSDFTQRPVQVIPAGNSGAAVTSIPIIVPPGRKGIEPNLSLNYNSNIGNGWLGVGWTLDMGAIQRSTKRGVNYNADDYVFTLNGSTSELVYIGNAPEGYREYRAKIEGAFSRYVYFGSGGGWVVTAKDGTKYYYGITSLSRQDNEYGSFKWCLDTVQDTNGNYMTITYFKDQGEIYLDRIDYTGNSNTGLAASNYIRFIRDNGNRIDAPIMYTTNSAVRTGFRLNTIEVYGNGQFVRRYVLDYYNSSTTFRSLLTSVTQYGSDGSALPAITINSYGGGGGFSEGWPINADLKDTCTPYTGDFNGDGKTDLLRACDNDAANYVYLSTGSGFTDGWPFGAQIKGSCVPYLGDFNGDGKTDLMRACDNMYDNRTWLSTGSGFIDAWNLITDLKTSCSPYLGDFNGDGKTDVMKVCDDNNQNYMWFSTGSGFTDGWPITTVLKLGCVPHPGDFNGDGKADFLRVCEFNNADNSVWLSTNNGFENGWYINEDLEAYCKPNLGDFNGDGKTDLMRTCYYYPSTTEDIKVWLSNGTGFTEGWDLTTEAYCSHYPGDFNGDGKTDFIAACFTEEYNYVWLSMGMGFTNGWPINADLKDICKAYPGDFNGDGKTDLMRACDNPAANYVWETAPYVSDMISSVSNGIGGTTTLEYRLSSEYDKWGMHLTAPTTIDSRTDGSKATTSSIRCHDVHTPLRQLRHGQ